ncbi:MAG: lipoyl synthase, partial [Planctomycetes bacterium]|nr:lipoyl synthase [Planctomycetota bacterium]
MKPSDIKHRKPAWLKKRLPPGGGVIRVEKLVEGYRLNTVCHGAKCPNRNDCYHQGTATFLILGDTCTRRCRFCAIPGHAPIPPDPGEPLRLAQAVKEMALSFVVITSVTRDDLDDGGSSHFAAVIRALRREVPGIGVEVLIPDFMGGVKALARVIEAEPTVLNHNIETVPSLYEKVRPEADFSRSLQLLSRAGVQPGLPTKSGLMVGLGETE